MSMRQVRLSNRQARRHSPISDAVRDISFLTLGATPQESLACAHAIPPEGILDKSLIYLFNR